MGVNFTNGYVPLCVFRGFVISESLLRRKRNREDGTYFIREVVTAALRTPPQPRRRDACDSEASRTYNYTYDSKYLRGV